MFRSWWGNSIGSLWWGEFDGIDDSLWGVDTSLRTSRRWHRAMAVVATVRCDDKNLSKSDERTLAHRSLIAVVR